MIICHPCNYLCLDLPVCFSSALEEHVIRWKIGEFLNSRHCTVVPPTYANYTKYVFTRHPYGRAYALWNMLCRDNFRLPQVARPFCEGNQIPCPPTWEQFVDLLGKRQDLKAQSRFYTWTMSEHLNGKFNAGKQWNKTYVFIPVENPKAMDYGPWGESVCMSARAREPWFMGMPNVEKFFSPEIRRKLDEWAADDFANFGYNHEVPDLGADLYQQAMAYAYDEDHLPFRYGLRPLIGTDGFNDYFRLPADIPEDPIVCLGSAYTFGRFTRETYVDLLAKKLNRPVLNLGGGLATPHSYVMSRPAMKVIHKAAAVIIQIMSARISPNTVFTFTNERCRGQIDMRTGKWLSEADTQWEKIRTEDPDLYRRMYQESLTSYKMDMVRLLAQVTGPKILVWWSMIKPQPVAKDPAWCKIYYPNYHPQMVDVGCVNLFRQYCAAYVEDQLVGDGWQPESEDVMERSPYYPSPLDHIRLANKLVSVPELQALKRT